MTFLVWNFTYFEILNLQVLQLGFWILKNLNLQAIPMVSLEYRQNVSPVLKWHIRMHAHTPPIHTHKHTHTQTHSLTHSHSHSYLHYYMSMLWPLSIEATYSRLWCPFVVVRSTTQFRTNQLHLYTYTQSLHKNICIKITYMPGNKNVWDNTTNK